MEWLESGDWAKTFVLIESRASTLSHSRHYREIPPSHENSLLYIKGVVVVGSNICVIGQADVPTILPHVYPIPPCIANVHVMDPLVSHHVFPVTLWCTPYS